MELRSHFNRKFVNGFVMLISAGSAIIGLGALVWILATVVQHGIQAINPAFFTEVPTPPGMKGGGLANAIAGTLLITIFATLTAVPIGVAAGVYLAEFGRDNGISKAVRFMTNVMIGVPSIIIGVFVYTIMVVPLKTFSGYAGVVALALIMLPIVVRTTEDMLNLVPDALREAALALGSSQLRVTLGVVFRAARNGMLTGILLAVARVSGETAPLLFTALNSPYWFKNLGGPTSNLTVTIFNYAMSPYSDWQQKAWGASLIIMAGVLALTIFARVMLQKSGRRS